MQRKLRIAMIAGGFVAATVLILLVIASVVGSTGVAIAGAVLGILLIMIAYMVAIKVWDRYSHTLDLLSTRIKNIESRMADQNFSGVDGLLQDRVMTAEKRQKLAYEQLLGVRKQLKVLRNRVPAGYMHPVQADIATLQEDTKALLQTTFESAITLGRRSQSVLNIEQARELFAAYLSNEQFLQLRPLIENFSLLEEQSLSVLRQLYRFYRRTGYWDLALLVIEQIQEISGLDTDANVALKLRHEIDVFAHPTRITVDLPGGSAYDPTGPILYLVGRVLPETQTGYTLRTQYTALAQSRKGLPVAVVGQSGITGATVEDIEHYDFQGIDYYLLPGPVRNEVLLDEWLRINITELSKLVLEKQPSILHAQSDFFNALIVNVVGEKYGIPTVYEARGFWEYSWLSRTITANNWFDSDSLFALYGLPSAYEYRENAEKTARTLTDHVFTLAEVMKDHILSSADDKINPENVSLVPNAVESANFPVQEKDQDLAATIGLPDGAVTVGYISSMVEYEGIDTLIDAFKQVTEETELSLSLLLVGDGDYLGSLRDKVSALQLENVYFTGRVPHEDILRYYGLIDIFVVPRKKSTVTDLVTPLKPFEAFSTGRTVILSDVGALREIADQSGVVELFRAGDSEDLARVIMKLVQDPVRREYLSSEAARWVRNHRSWDSNVNEYYRVYRKLGYKGPRNLEVEAELALLRYDLNPGEIVDTMADAELPKLRGWFTIQEVKQSASSILTDGWRFASFDPVPVMTLEDWARYGDEHRSWGFHLHAWEFMDPLLAEYDTTGDIEWLEAAVNIALGWVESHCVPGDTEDPMVWYDMSLALRTPRLIALVLRVARVKEMRAAAIILAAAVVRHFEELSLDRAFNPNNNHGFYTAVSQVHIARYMDMFPQADSTASQGNKRLVQMAMSQFANDGTHLEHSPDYHRMLLNSFEQAVNDDLIEDDEIKRRVQRAANVLGWMVQPDGTLVQLGDSPETRVVRPGAKSIDPNTQYILSDGTEGQKPEEELAVFADGGYAFVRSPQPQGPGRLRESGYLAFSAAFHSRAHKHADDLNVVWYDRGQQILTDAGRFGYGELLPQDSPLRQEGYYYAAPERQYVEGTMAHNTLMMDGQNQERRTRKPYGSGIAKCVANDGIFDLTGRVQHQDYVHRRRVIYRPGVELLLKDSIYSQAPEQREATVWLNIAGHFELEEQDNTLMFFSEVGGRSTRLHIEGPGRLIEPVLGQTQPLRGWRSRHDRSIEPTWSVGFVFQLETRASVQTRLSLSD